jgi:hypothetical protein
MRSNNSSSTTLPVDASETSPLLGKSDTYPKVVDGVLPNGTFPNGAIDDANDEERQAEEDLDREGQFEGMPEVRKKLKYILPAVSIGVNVLWWEETHVLTGIDSSCCSGPDDYREQLWEDWE